MSFNRPAPLGIKSPARAAVRNQMQQVRCLLQRHGAVLVAIASAAGVAQACLQAVPVMTDR